MIGLFLLILDFGGWNLHALKKKKKRFFQWKNIFPFFTLSFNPSLPLSSPTLFHRLTHLLLCNQLLCYLPSIVVVSLSV